MSITVSRGQRAQIVNVATESSYPVVFTPLLRDFAAPSTERQGGFSRPSNLGRPWNFLWPVAWAEVTLCKFWDEALGRPCSFCLWLFGVLSWDGHFRKLVQPAEEWEATWRRIEAAQLTAKAPWTSHPPVQENAATGERKQNQQRNCPATPPNYEKELMLLF